MLSPHSFVSIWLLCVCALSLHGETVSPLFARGYTVLPAPQRVKLEAHDFEFTNAFHLSLAPGVSASDVAVQSINDLLAERFHLTLSSRTDTRALRLSISPNTVHPDAITDSDKAAVAEQAYRLELAPNHIAITGNSPTGLFYGVQTFIQLLKVQNGTLTLPAGTIEDWPDLGLRIIYWDDAHHLEHPDVLKAALKQASFYKINGFSIKLEGHFQYRHAAPIVEPYALSPAELQELTDYGLKYHVQVVPYLDAPAHDAFILKHPEYADLREYPDSNYEFCSTNPKTRELFQGLFDDLLAANKGSKYFVLSTDEPYYIGLADNAQCHEAERAKQLGSVGKLFGEFVTQTASYLHDRGRTVIFWGEYPMKPDDISSFPTYLVNGEVYGPDFDPKFKAHGFRQLLFTSTVGWKEYLFPNYYLLPQSEHLPGPTGGTYEPVSQSPGVVDEMFDFLSFNAARQRANLIGSFIAGWADVGLHPETMWLGYTTESAVAWHPGTSGSREMMSAFYRLFYGTGATNMGRLYQLMSEQAQFWKESWEVQASAARTPYWGDWNIIYKTPHPSSDQTLPVLPVPQGPLLVLTSEWQAQDTRRLQMAGSFLSTNDELLNLLYNNLSRVQFQHYNLQIYLTIAKLYRQNLAMLSSMAKVESYLRTAQAAAKSEESARAVAALDQALDTAEDIRMQRNTILSDAESTWYQHWYPRVEEANGRRFLDKVDDVKDHLPVRTVDLSYLIYRELLYPFGDWARQTLAARNQYAEAYHLPARRFVFDWQKTAGATK